MSKKPYKKVEAQVIDPIENIEEVGPEVASDPIEITDLPVIEPVVESAPISTVKVKHPSLRRRSAPTYEAEVIGLIQDQGIYDIYEVQGTWGKLKDNSWISLEFTENLEEKI